LCRCAGAGGCRQSVAEEEERLFSGREMAESSARRERRDQQGK